MHDSDIDELGPVDYVVVEFPADQANFSGEMAAQLTALVKSGIVRVLDLLFSGRTPMARWRVLSPTSSAMATSGSCAGWRRSSRCCSPRRTSNRSEPRLSRKASRPYWLGERLGRAVRCRRAAVGVSSWPVAGSRFRRLWPHWRQMRQPRRKESEMLGRGRVGRPGVLGGRPVARTAAVAGTAAVAMRGVRRRGDRREDPARRSPRPTGGAASLPVTGRDVLASPCRGRNDSRRHGRDSGGAFPDGLGRLLPRRGAGARGRGRLVCDRPRAGHSRAVRAVRRRDRIHHGCRAASRSR